MVIPIVGLMKVYLMPMFKIHLMNLRTQTVRKCPKLLCSFTIEVTNATKIYWIEVFVALVLVALDVAEWNHLDRLNHMMLCTLESQCLLSLSYVYAALAVYVIQKNDVYAVILV